MDVRSEFIEVETGKCLDALEKRPQLAAALLSRRNACSGQRAVSARHYDADRPSVACV
jgi:hypothetical protein